VAGSHFLLIGQLLSCLFDHESFNPISFKSLDFCGFLPQKPFNSFILVSSVPYRLEFIVRVVQLLVISNNSVTMENLLNV